MSDRENPGSERPSLLDYLGEADFNRLADALVTMYYDRFMDGVDRHADDLGVDRQELRRAVSRFMIENKIEPSFEWLNKQSDQR